MKSAERHQRKIVALGDSLTIGFPFEQRYSWPGILEREKGLNIINMGINGDTVEGMLERFYDHVVKLSPDLVVITGGTNDVFNKVPLDLMKKNLLEMIKRAEANEITPVIGIIPPIDEPTLRLKLKGFVDFLRDLKHHYSTIDFYSALVDEKEDRIKEEYDLDGVHPNKKGYEKMAEAAWDVLKHLI